MNEFEFSRLFEKFPEKEPKLLKRKYPRIFASILAKWNNPKEENKYLGDLIIDGRGDRLGFEQEIISEILFISKVYSKWIKSRAKKASQEILKELSVEKMHEIDLELEKWSEPMAEKMALLISWIKTNESRKILEFCTINRFDINQRDDTGKTLLMHAVIENQEDVVMRLISEGKANPHFKDNAGNTALHWALVKNNERLMDILLFFGADPNAVNKKGVSPFSLSSIKNELRFLKRLYEYGGDLDSRDIEGNSVLHKAVLAKNKEIVMFIINSGGSVNLPNKHQQTPEFLAQNSDLKSVFDNFKAQKLMEQVERERR